MGNDEAYAPFGEQYANTGTTTMFTGQWNMVQTDYEDFLFRKYHFVQGRWVSPDPAGLKAAHLKNPQSWNQYAYVMNNPLAWVDPQGLEDCLFTRVHRRDEDVGGCGEGGSSIDVGSDERRSLWERRLWKFHHHSWREHRGQCGRKHLRQYAVHDGVHK